MSLGRRRARRAIGVGLLVPGLVLASPPDAGAAEVPAKPPEKQPSAKATTPARRAGAPAASPGEPCVTDRGAGARRWLNPAPRQLGL